MNENNVGTTRNGPVVVVGGGIVGLAALRELEKRAGDTEIILIEPREYAEVPFAALRGLTDPTGIGQVMRKPLLELTAARHIIAKAVEIVENEVVLEDGSKIPFAYAIVATGSTTKGYPFLKGGAAETVTDREQQFSDEGKKLKDAKSILIIGGGPVGVELAGEIGSAYPNKNVTLVHATDRLLPALPAGAGNKAHRVLTNMGIQVVLETYLTQEGEYYTSREGRQFTADLVYVAIGIQTNAIPVDGQTPINDKNQLQVDEYLQVRGRKNVFAIGDVNDVPEVKLGATGGMQAGVAAQNIAALRGGQSEKLKTYKPAKPMGFVTLGKAAGIAQLPFGRLDFMIAMKQKDMFISRFLKSK